MRKQMYTVKEAAQALGLCEMTIYRQVKNNSIPSKRIGRSIRISASYIEEMVKNPISDIQKFVFAL